MAIVREIRKRARQVAPPVLGACLVAYFAYHAIQGERGFLAWLSLRQELAQARADAAQLAREHERLERRVELLRPDSLDLDLLDERAHELLGYGRPDELIILLPEDEARQDPYSELAPTD